VSSTTYSGTLTGSDGSRITITSATLLPAEKLAPVVTVPPVAVGAWPRQISAYRKMWRTSKYAGLAASMGTDVTEVRLAFAQGSPPLLVGWGSQTREQVIADCATLRSRGVAISVSIGGAGGRVDLSNHSTFCNAIVAIHKDIGIDRIDWDIESSALNAADVIAISQQLHDTIGTMVTMAPNGSNVGQYLPVGVQLHKRSLLAAWGQQFYDAPVSLTAATGRIRESIAAGIPAEITQVGMMIGNDERHWTLDTCAAHMAAIRAAWPSISGAYLWSETQTDIALWAARMRQALQ